MLANKKFRVILSLIIAICLWAYVIGETNPKDTRTIREIPITMLNEQTMEDNDLAILSVSAATISVTLSGNRADIKPISAGDISAYVDLKDAVEGENQLKVVLRVPDRVDIEDTSLSRITVVLEARESKEVPVEVVYAGDYGADTEPVTVDMDRKAVVVAGAASLVAQVDHAEAVVETGAVTEQLRTVRTALRPVDANGAAVQNVRLSSDSVQVSAQLVTAKTVKLSVPLRDDNAELVEKSVDAPKTIVIKGKASALAEIETVTCEEIDLSDVTEDTEIALTPILPEGVEVSTQSLEKLVLQVKAKPMEEKTLTFTEADLELTGLDEVWSATVTPTRITLLLRGRSETLDTLKAEDFQLRLQLSGLEEGTHRVAVEVTCRKEDAYTTLEIDPKEVKVEIEER